MKNPYYRAGTASHRAGEGMFASLEAGGKRISGDWHGQVGS